LLNGTGQPPTNRSEFHLEKSRLRPGEEHEKGVSLPG
jgi:hypothetical protein